MKTIANISAGELVNGWSCCQNQYMAKLIAQVPGRIRKWGGTAVCKNQV